MVLDQGDGPAWGEVAVQFEPPLKHFTCKAYPLFVSDIAKLNLGAALNLFLMQLGLRVEMTIDVWQAFRQLTGVSQ